jgi:hypothetical protein
VTDPPKHLSRRLNGRAAGGLGGFNILRNSVSVSVAVSLLSPSGLVPSPVRPAQGARCANSRCRECTPSSSSMDASGSMGECISKIGERQNSINIYPRIDRGGGESL